MYRLWKREREKTTKPAMFYFLYGNIINFYLSNLKDYISFKQVFYSFKNKDNILE